MEERGLVFYPVLGKVVDYLYMDSGPSNAGTSTVWKRGGTVRVLSDVRDFYITTTSWLRPGKLVEGSEYKYVVALGRGAGKVETVALAHRALVVDDGALVRMEKLVVGDITELENGGAVVVCNAPLQRMIVARGNGGGEVVVYENVQQLAFAEVETVLRDSSGRVLRDVARAVRARGFVNGESADEGVVEVFPASGIAVFLDYRGWKQRQRKLLMSWKEQFPEMKVREVDLAIAARGGGE